MFSTPWPVTGHIKATALYVLKFTKLRQELQICKALNNFPLSFIHFFPASCSQVLLSKQVLTCDIKQQNDSRFSATWWKNLPGSFSVPLLFKEINPTCQNILNKRFFVPLFMFFQRLTAEQLSSLARTCLWYQVATQNSVRRDEKKSFRVHLSFPCGSTKLIWFVKTFFF